MRKGHALYVIVTISNYGVGMAFFQVLQCCHCQLVFVNPCLNNKALDSVYQGHHHKRVENKEKVSMRVRQYEIDRDFLCGDTIDHGKILDVGSGGGFFLNTFNSQNWERVALDIDPDAVKHAENIFGIEAHRSSDGSDSMPFEDEQFDVVSFRGSFEHLVNPHITIKEVSRILKPNGYLYISAIPNVEAYCAKLYRNKWNLYDAKEHIFMYSLETLRKLLANEGFDYKKHAFFYLETPYADVENDINKVAKDQKLFRDGRGDEVDISPPFWDNMLSLIVRKSHKVVIKNIKTLLFFVFDKILLKNKHFS